VAVVIRRFPAATPCSTASRVVLGARVPGLGGAGEKGGSRMREVVQRGLYYDELEPGVVYRHRPGRTLTEADDVVFSTLTMNHQALHLDAAWAATQPFGQRLVNSMMTLSTVVGLSVG